MAITQYAVSLEPRNDMSRNVQDMYKRSLDAEIRADLFAKRSSAVNIIINSENDFNVATAIRTHNGFNGGELYIVGKRKYDRRGTVGTHNYSTIFHSPTHEEVFEKLRKDGYTIYAVDNMPEYNPTNIWDVEFPERSAFVYGTENAGLEKEVIDACDEMVFVEMYGSVRSFNLACTTAIVLGEYSRQHRNSRPKN